MFDESASSDIAMIPASSDNKLRFTRWLLNAEIEGRHSETNQNRLAEFLANHESMFEQRILYGTDPRESLSLAFQMDPDAVFLLTDGVLQDWPCFEFPTIEEMVDHYVSDRDGGRSFSTILLDYPMSKVRMRDLADRGFGTFAFIQFADRIPILLTSKNNVHRFAALEYTASKATQNFQERREFAFRHLIPLLNDESLEISEHANRILHELCFNICRPETNSKTKSRVVESRRENWIQFWNRAALDHGYDPRTQTGLFRQICQGHLAKHQLLETDISQLSPNDQVVFARRVLAVLTAEPELVRDFDQLLLNTLMELNRETKVRFGSLFLNNFDHERAAYKFRQIMDAREKLADKWMRRSQSHRYSEVEQRNYLNRIVSLMPETSSASMVQTDHNSMAIRWMGIE